MKFTFTPPMRYDLTQIILGESETNSGTLNPVASSVSIGSFPTWINEYDYPSSINNYYYAVKWKYANGGYSDWSSPRMVGKTGIETDYILINPSGSQSIYIMNPVSGDVANTQGTWLEHNKEYYVTIDKSLTGSTTLPMLEDYTFSFTSEYCPLFVTVYDIKYEVGDFISNLTDDTINRIIHKNSKAILNRYIQFAGGYPKNYTCNGKYLSEAFRRYVLCKSSLDAILAVQLSMGGKTLKKLADVTFQYGASNSSGDTADKKKQLKECIDNQLIVIFSNHSFQVGVRGSQFARYKHPMSKDDYSRLSMNNLGYDHNLHSQFDESLNI